MGPKFAIVPTVRWQPSALLCCLSGPIRGMLRSAEIKPVAHLYRVRNWHRSDELITIERVG